MTRGQRTRERLFDPYTGKDWRRGDRRTAAPQLAGRLHDDLLGGPNGPVVNGVGALLFTLLCLTGAVIWWPGHRAVVAQPVRLAKAGWKRFNWDLHSATGLLDVPVRAHVGRSAGSILSYADPFVNLVDFLQPLDPYSTRVAIRRRFPGVARARPFRARLRDVGQVALRGAGTRARRVVHHRRDHVVEPRAAAGV